MKNELILYFPIAKRIFARAVCLFILYVVGSSQLHSQEIDEVWIDPTQEYQKIEGFGASIMGWREDMIEMYQDSAYLDYVVNELGLSIFRMQIWPDVSTTPIERIEDIRYEDFVWEGPGRRGRINMEFAKRILKINPEIKIIGSIWSPPAWMKESQKIQGSRAGFLLDPNRDYDDDNRLRDDMYGHYAKWIFEWVAYMESEGVPLYALGPQNELMFTEPYESCMFTPAEFARLVRMIGERFEMENFPRPIIYGPEDMTLATYEAENKNARHTPYVDALMAEDVAPYFDVFATHGYTDGVEAGGRLDPKKYWESIRQFGRPYWITEGGTGGHEWPTPIENGIASYIHHALVDGNVNAFVCWQISDVVRNTHGVMERRIPTPKTYAAMHCWRSIRPGFHRIAAGTSAKNLLVSAFKNPATEQLVVVVINDGASERPVHFRISPVRSESFTPFTTSHTLEFSQGREIQPDHEGMTLSIPGKSIITLVQM